MNQCTSWRHRPAFGGKWPPDPMAGSSRGAAVDPNVEGG
jgi:hypothetical protein